MSGRRSTIGQTLRQNASRAACESGRRERHVLGRASQPWSVQRRRITAPSPHCPHRRSADRASPFLEGWVRGSPCAAAITPDPVHQRARSFLHGGPATRRLALAWERTAARWTDVFLCVSEAEHRRGIAAGVGGAWAVVPNAVPGRVRARRRGRAGRDQIGVGARGAHRRLRRTARSAEGPGRPALGVADHPKRDSERGAGPGG